MEIREALGALSGLLDSLCEYGEYSAEELERIGAIENAIYNYVRSKGDI